MFQKHLAATVGLLAWVSSTGQWTIVPSGTLETLTGAIHDHGRYLVAGSEGAFLRSLDDGNTFEATEGYVPGDGGGFNHIAFFDSLSGMATSTMVCCDVQQTLDGGNTWQPRPPYPTGPAWIQPVNDQEAISFHSGPGLDFTTAGLLLAETEFNVYVDVDSICNEIYEPGSCVEVTWNGQQLVETGGWGWVKLSSDRAATNYRAVFNYGFYAYEVQLLPDEVVVYMDYNGELRFSSDGGGSWTLPRSVPADPVGVVHQAFHMSDTENGILVGSDGTIHVTDDGGLSWTAITPITDQDLRAVRYLDGSRVLAVGDGGTILRSLDGGLTWAEEASGTTANLLDIAVSASTVIVVGEEGTILRYDSSTGLAVGRPETGLSAYPIPFSDVITVNALQRSGPVRFTLRDALGRVTAVRQERSPAATQWSLQYLPAGWYVLEMEAAGQATQRLRILKR